MTLILTAPTRLALMLTDAHPDIKTSFPTWQDNISNLRRPAWDVQIGEATYDPQAANYEEGTEEYLLSLIGEKYVAGSSETHELQARSIVEATWRYFVERPNLQFANDRGLEAAPLSGLNGVYESRLSRRSNVTLMRRGGGEAGGEEEFWGATYTLRVRFGLSVMEML
jgi:hypothetical protein